MTPKMREKLTRFLFHDFCVCLIAVPFTVMFYLLIIGIGWWLNIDTTGALAVSVLYWWMFSDRVKTAADEADEGRLIK